MVYTGTSASARGVYSSLNQGLTQDRVQLQDSAHGQAFPLRESNQPRSNRNHTSADVRVSIADSCEGKDNERDQYNEDDEEDLEDLDDIVPLASSNRYYRSGSAPGSSSSSPSSRVSHPCKVLAAIFAAAVVISLAFALLSLLHLNTNNTLDNGASRVLKPPPGINADDFKLPDFKPPPWDWDINSYVPIDITNGLKFARVVWNNGGGQYLAVDCPNQANYRYHFPSFLKDEFRDYPTTSQGIDDLLPMGQEPYVFVLCPPGINNANIVFREFDKPNDPLPVAPPHVDGTMEAPQPLLDDVVMILVDAMSRAKFNIAMKTVMETFVRINSTTGSEGHAGYRIFDFEHYNVLGQNSPANKAFLYSGQSIENIMDEPKHWIWEVFEEQGFKTAHTDGECGGEQGIYDYTAGAITFEYAQSKNHTPAQYQMTQTVWCHNHNMHVVPNVWGQSCTLPNGLNYDKTLMGGMRWDTPYCAGEMAIHEHIMENLEGWLSSTKGQRRFATYTFMDAHTPVSIS